MPFRFPPPLRRRDDDESRDSPLLKVMAAKTCRLTGGQPQTRCGFNQPAEDPFMCAGRAPKAVRGCEPAWHLQASELAQNELTRNSAELVNFPFETPESA